MAGPGAVGLPFAAEGGLSVDSRCASRPGLSCGVVPGNAEFLNHSSAS